MYTHADRNAIIHRISTKVKPELFTIREHPWFLNKYTLVPPPFVFDFVSLIVKDLQNSSIKTILDIGTGSGIIAVLLDKEQKWRIYASDISTEALVVAQKNTRLHHGSVYYIQNADGVWGSELEKLPQKIDCIVSNPPFVGQKEFNSDSFRKHYPEALLEPKAAVITRDSQGLEPYVEILRNGIQQGAHLFYFILNAEHSREITKEIRSSFPAATVTLFTSSDTLERFLRVTIL